LAIPCNYEVTETITSLGWGLNFNPTKKVTCGNQEAATERQYAPMPLLVKKGNGTIDLFRLIWDKPLNSGITFSIK